jgi:hypothetical protein
MPLLNTDLIIHRCLDNEQLMDTPERGEMWRGFEPANAITRDRETDTRCLTISVVERGQTLTHCALRESSAVLLESGLDREIELQIESAS